ncbi:MAG: leucyl aminopeptidase family protein [Alphaproteobacteria bacterium]|nr:leucyl aminopeptidase family protein [Alphaproteobacteria bacterium]
MSKYTPSFTLPFTANAKKNICRLHLETAADNKPALEPVYGSKGDLQALYLKVDQSAMERSGAEAAARIQGFFPATALKTLTFDIAKAPKGFDPTAFCLGWALASYRYRRFKKNGESWPVLLWPKGTDRKRVQGLLEATFLLRDIVNAPANVMGPQEMEESARVLARTFNAKITVTADEALLDKNFPLIYAVGNASPRRPRLIDLRWGRAKDPKLTLVGKGVSFDTGGLNLKPGDMMRLMKKDVGGAAHVLGLAYLIMDSGLPVNLRVLIPTVENAVGGAAFRPGDVFVSRKGLSVENTNTDAEGRLILADALTYASEDMPDFIIDCATLTGSARAALGPDIPALFCNRDKIVAQLQDISFKMADPLWPMPLWAGYKKHLASPIADMVNSAPLPGDLIYSALFLQEFVDPKIDWVHLDLYAWEHTGKPGRVVGGAENGLRAMFAYLEKRYG